MLVEVENREHAEILMKMKPFITLKYKPPPMKDAIGIMESLEA